MPMTFFQLPNMPCKIPPQRYHLLSSVVLMPQSPQVRMAGMKVLGSLMGSVEELFVSAGLASVYQVQALLANIADTDASPEARGLAEKLLSVFAG